jgi:hypothetical protein
VKAIPADDNGAARSTRAGINREVRWINIGAGAADDAAAAAAAIVASGNDTKVRAFYLIFFFLFN